MKYEFTCQSKLMEVMQWVSEHRQCTEDASMFLDTDRMTPRLHVYVNDDTFASMYQLRWGEISNRKEA